MTDDIVKLTKGARVSTKFGLGVVTDDYWRDRDRFRVRLDDGTEHDFCSASLREATRAAPERAVKVPDGFKLMPVALTPKMLEDAAFNLSDEFGADFVAPLGAFAKALYEELLTAAPVPALVPSTGAVKVRDGWQLVPLAPTTHQKDVGGAICGNRDIAHEVYRTMVTAAPATAAVKARELRFVFDKFPCPEGPRFIEVEDEHGCSLSAGEWRQREDGLVELAVPSALVPDPAAGEVVAWAEQYGSKIVSVSLTQGRFHTVPLYAAPAREALAPSGETDGDER